MSTLRLSIVAITIGISSWSCQSSTEPQKSDAGASQPGEKSLRIAYVNSDSLLEKYQMLKDLEDEFLAEKLNMENEFRRHVEQLEKDYMEAEREAPSLSQEALQILQRNLAQREQELMQKKQLMENELLQSEQEKNDRYYTRIRKFLDAYGKRNGYDIIFSYNGFGNVVYMNEAYDITDIVVDSLNARYQTEKAQ